MSFKDFSTAQNDPAKSNPASAPANVNASGPAKASDPKAAPAAGQPSGPPVAPAPSEAPAKS
jgi:hypothetical protein